jgi:amino acid transporter
MQWIHNVTWFPAILSFSAAALAYLIHPPLAENKLYLLSAILIGFWGFTLFNFIGLKVSSWFSALGVIGGTIIPGAVLIGLALYWLGTDQPVQIAFSANELIPPLTNVENLVFLTGLFLAFGGLEVSAVHAREVQNPRKTFPRAILLAASLTLVLYLCGAIAIAIMIPSDRISLVSGLIETFELFFHDLGAPAFFPLIALLIVWGAVAELNAWVIGPVRALHATAKHGDLPPVFQKLNKHGVPTNLLLFQGAIVTAASFVFLLMPTASTAFWVLSVISVHIYLVMYILMFLAAIKLRYSHPKVERPYQVPYGRPGIWFFGLLGTFGCLLAFVVGFIPPAQLETGNVLIYDGLLAFGLFIAAAIPLLLYRYRSPAWQRHYDETASKYPPDKR